jgi:hypothetical protein
MLLRLLEDKNGEVQNLAVKCLGPLVNKVKEAQVRSPRMIPLCGCCVAGGNNSGHIVREHDVRPGAAARCELDRAEDGDRRAAGRRAAAHVQCHATRHAQTHCRCRSVTFLVNIMTRLGHRVEEDKTFTVIEFTVDFFLFRQWRDGEL